MEIKNCPFCGSSVTIVEEQADTVIKENDHAMDDIRYFCNTIMKNKVRKESTYTPIFM